MGKVAPLKFTLVLLVSVLVAGCAAMRVGSSQDSKTIADKAYFGSKDYDEAFYHYKASADQGDAEAQYRLGQMYRRGQSVANDPVESVYWTREAAGKGHDAATMALAAWHLRGENGLARNPAEAANLLNPVAGRGNPEAMYTLGVLYAFGEGVEKNTARAVSYFNSAKKAGYPVPAELLDSKVLAKARSANKNHAAQGGKELIKAVQAGLVRLGYKSVGRPDGIAGKQTNAAVRQFQNKSGMPVDGKITPELLEHIEAELAAKQ